MKLDLDPKMQLRLLRGCIEDSDLPEVQRLLAGGCCLSHPDMAVNPLALALRIGNAGIVDALLDAGARLDPKHMQQSIVWAIQHDNARFISEAIERGDIPRASLDGLMLEAASKAGGEAVALKLLELDANPLLQDQKGQTALDHAVTRNRYNVVSSVFARCSQGHKNRLLAKFTQYGFTRCVTLLLEAGANPNHIEKGRTLLQIAPRDAEDVKRVLRAAKTSASVDTAMGGNEESEPPSPTRSSLTL